MKNAGKFIPFSQSTSSIIVRELDGNIIYFNRAAARQYGFSPSEALGSVSHHLFSTVFPYPLDQINKELLTAGVWEGELLHTLSDGRRVKVRSRWELTADRSPARAEPQLKVVERNDAFQKVLPSSSHLAPELGIFGPILQALNSRRRIWIISALLTALMLKLFFSFTEEVTLLPLFE